MVQIVAYNPKWPGYFAAISDRLKGALGDSALRIDHIGSTAIPNMPAKDIIDLMVTIASPAQFDGACAKVESLGYQRRAEITADNGPLPWSAPDPEQWRKRFLKSIGGEGQLRAAHIHIRVDGWPNQRYALLFRDFLRANHHAAAMYADAKQRIAAHVDGNLEKYIDLKQPVCDLIALMAEQWAKMNGWQADETSA